MGKLIVSGGFTLVYLTWSLSLSFIFFICGMCHRPIRTYQETKRKKYRRMAEQALAGKPAFDIKPLDYNQKQIVLRKFENQKKLLRWCLIGLWVFNIVFHISVYVQNMVSFYYYSIVLILQIVLTAVCIRSNKKKYEKAEEAINQLGVLKAVVIGYYHMIHRWKYRKKARLYWHFIISAYVDQKQKVCCFHKCNGYHLGKVNTREMIDVLMYKDQFAGYSISDHPKVL